MYQPVHLCSEVILQGFLFAAMRITDIKLIFPPETALKLSQKIHDISLPKIAKTEYLASLSFFNFTPGTNVSLCLSVQGIL